MGFAGIVVFGYLLGSCPWGYWLVRIFHGEDVREQGSRSIGASNVFRLYGRSLGVPVTLLDLAKGLVPALVGTLAVSPLCGIVAGAAAMLGHWRPLFLGFARGGKLVATAGGVFLGVAPLAALGAGAVWLLAFAFSRYTSVASLLAAVVLPIACAAFGYPVSVVVFAAVTGGVVIVLHRANVRRLWAGTENRFRLRRTAHP